MKGPDVMSKSDRTQRRYADSWANQTTLDTFLSRSESPVNAGQRRKIISLNSESDEGDGGGHEYLMAVKRRKSVPHCQWQHQKHRDPEDLSDNPPPSSNDSLIDLGVS